MSIHRIVPAAVAAVFALITALPADAKPNPKPPKVKPATAKATTVKPTGAHGPKTTAKAKPTTAKAHGAQAKAVKPAKTTGTAAGTGKAKTKTSGDVAKGSSHKAKGEKATRMSGNDLTTAPAGTQDIDSTGTPTQLSKAQQKLLKNEHLRAKLQSRLPAGVNVDRAAGGFKNLGQFVAAVNVSHNQGLDFRALRTLMIGPESLSLGQAIQRLKGGDPRTANATADAAITAANRDVAASVDVTTTKPKTKRTSRG